MLGLLGFAWFVIVAGEAAAFGLPVPVFRQRANRMQVAAVNRNLNATTAAQLAGDVPPDWAETSAGRHGETKSNE
jgi:hypothetical protein